MRAHAHELAHGLMAFSFRRAAMTVVGLAICLIIWEAWLVGVRDRTIGTRLRVHPGTGDVLPSNGRILLGGENDVTYRSWFGLVEQRRVGEGPQTADWLAHLRFRRISLASRQGDEVPAQFQLVDRGSRDWAQGWLVPDRPLVVGSTYELVLDEVADGVDGQERSAPGQPAPGELWWRIGSDVDLAAPQWWDRPRVELVDSWVDDGTSTHAMIVARLILPIVPEAPGPIVQLSWLEGSKERIALVPLSCWRCGRPVPASKTHPYEVQVPAGGGLPGIEAWQSASAVRVSVIDSAGNAGPAMPLELEK